MKRLLVKVCGLTREEDVRRADELGADLLGFIFHKKSPRNVDPAFVAALPKTSARKVGVFVDQDADEVRAIMDAARLDLAQLHGDQDRAFCVRVGASRVIRVFWPARHAALEDARTADGLPGRALADEMRTYADAAAFFLLDAGTSGGGHGQAFDPGLLAGLESPCPVFVAGGLGPQNLAIALALPGIAGVDLNSGVESAPGVKDPDKLGAAFALLKN